MLISNFHLHGINRNKSDFFHRLCVPSFRDDTNAVIIPGQGSHDAVHMQSCRASYQGFLDHKQVHYNLCNACVISGHVWHIYTQSDPLYILECSICTYSILSLRAAQHMTKYNQCFRLCMKKGVKRLYNISHL